MINTNNIQKELITSFPQFKTIWVDYTSSSKRRGEYKIAITVFPIDNSGYRMFFSDNVNAVSFNNCVNIIKEKIKNVEQRKDG